MKNFIQVEKNKLKNYEGGFALTACLSTLITTVIPGIISIAGSIVGVAKSGLSEKGEIKVKDQTYKWDNSTSSSMVSNGNFYCI